MSLSSFIVMTFVCLLQMYTCTAASYDPSLMMKLNNACGGVNHFNNFYMWWAKLKQQVTSNSIFHQSRYKSIVNKYELDANDLTNCRTLYRNHLIERVFPQFKHMDEIFNVGKVELDKDNSKFTRAYNFVGASVKIICGIATFQAAEAANGFERLAKMIQASGFWADAIKQTPFTGNLGKKMARGIGGWWDKDYKFFFKDHLSESRQKEVYAELDEIQNQLKLIEDQLNSHAIELNDKQILAIQSLKTQINDAIDEMGTAYKVKSESNTEDVFRSKEKKKFAFYELACEAIKQLKWDETGLSHLAARVQVNEDELYGMCYRNKVTMNRVIQRLSDMERIIDRATRMMPQMRYSPLPIAAAGEIAAVSFNRRQRLPITAVETRNSRSIQYVVTEEDGEDDASPSHSAKTDEEIFDDLKDNHESEMEKMDSSSASSVSDGNTC